MTYFVKKNAIFVKTTRPLHLHNAKKEDLTMMTRMMTRSLMMMTRSCQRREKDHRAQFSGTRKQFSPPLILVNTFLKMFTSTIQHCHPVFTDRCSLLEVTKETNNYDGATIILDPQSKWLHINNFAFQNSWEDTFEIKLFESFFLSFEKKGVSPWRGLNLGETSSPGWENIIWMLWIEVLVSHSHYQNVQNP